MEKSAVQIPLSFQDFDHHDLKHYRPGKNRHVLKHLHELIFEGDPAVTYLWGERGTGKSHLLQALCTRVAAYERRSAYIPLSQRAAGLMPALLEGLEQLDLVCIDDLEEVVGDSGWEQALFNLFNRIRENRRSLILTAAMSPNGLPLRLPDLRSRLQSATIFHLQPLNEEERVAALKQRAELRGIGLNDEVTAYLVRRVPRDMHSLFQLLDRLDRAGLQAKRKITIPFIRELLEQG